MFYEVIEDEGRRKRYTSAYVLGTFEKPIGICPRCGREIEKSKNAYSKNAIALIRENYADFIPYYISYGIVSARFKEIAEKEKLIGLTFMKADIISSADLSADDIRELRIDGIPLKNVVANPPEYYKMDIEQGAVYHEKSKIIIKTSCDECGIKIYATEGQMWIAPREEYPIIIDAKSLKGYDMFYAEGYGLTVFCTERFYEVYQQNKLTGLKFVPIEVI